jgi:hypothetical protein
MSIRDIEDLLSERGLAATNPDLDILRQNGNLAV